MQEALEEGGPDESTDASFGQALASFGLAGWLAFVEMVVFKGLGSVFRFLLFLWILFGAARGAPTEERGLSVWSPDSVGLNGDGNQVCLLTEDVANFWRTTECEGAVQSFCMSVLLTIGVWEIWKSVWRRFRPTRGPGRTVGCQTDGRGVVPLPLSEGIPHRGRILFLFFGKEVSLWKPRAIPNRCSLSFIGLVGDYLRKVEDGEVSDSASSG